MDQLEVGRVPGFRLRKLSPAGRFRRGTVQIQRRLSYSAGVGDLAPLLEAIPGSRMAGWLNSGWGCEGAKAGAAMVFDPVQWMVLFGELARTLATILGWDEGSVRWLLRVARPVAYRRQVDSI